MGGSLSLSIMRAHQHSAAAGDGGQLVEGNTIVSGVIMSTWAKVKAIIFG